MHTTKEFDRALERLFYRFGPIRYLGPQDASELPGDRIVLPEPWLTLISDLYDTWELMITKEEEKKNEDSLYSD